MKVENDGSIGRNEVKLIQQLQLLHDHVITTYEAERRLLSSYLHDTVIQVLSAVHIQLSTLALDFPDLAQSELPDSLDMIVELVEGLLGAVRSLRPLELDLLDLNDVLKQASEEFSRLTGISVEYVASEIPHSLPEAEAVAFYRLVQEQFVNVLKHAKATRIWVTMEARDDSLVLTIKDDGRGFDSGGKIDDFARAPGLGLLGLMVRFQQLDGRVSIHSANGQGTTVIGYLPQPQPESY